MGDMPQHLEIERKFLVKDLPNRKPSCIVQIDQYYWKNPKGVWERVRTWHTNTGERRWIHTVKKYLSKGVNIEDEKDITESEYKSFIKKCSSVGQSGKFISKTRHIYIDANKMKWEIDVFNTGAKIIMAEVELPKKSFRLKIPKFVKEIVLLEVTELKKFSNRNLANEI
jgi:CYTH domain-containing protein